MLPLAYIKQKSSCQNLSKTLRTHHIEGRMATLVLDTKTQLPPFLFPNKRSLNIDGNRNTGQNSEHFMQVTVVTTVDNPP